MLKIFIKALASHEPLKLSLQLIIVIIYEKKSVLSLTFCTTLLKDVIIKAFQTTIM